MKKVLSVNPCNIDLAKKFSKYLKVLIILCVIIEILVTLGILLLIYQIIASVSVNTIIAEYRCYEVSFLFNNFKC
jgi:hypothetical protein